ncbi:MAG: polysaccharide pyruvyl transferase family protein [Paludibacteraceae bacterium]
MSTFKVNLSSFTKRLVETFRYFLTSSNERIVIGGYVHVYNNKVKHVNYGDDLTYYLLKELTGSKIFHYENLFFPNSRTHILCIGSIIESWSNPHSVIWGSGLMYRDKPLLEKPKEVRAVRGPLTRKLLLDQGVRCPEVFGDPALLLPLIYEPVVRKKFRYGIIPHYIDWNNYKVEMLANNLENCKLINMAEYDHWQDLINDINECECILSSSLHGLIISDAYKVPNVWIEFSDKILGNQFKYMDYFQSVKRNVTATVVVDSLDCIREFQKFETTYEDIEVNIDVLLKSAPFKIRKKFLQ